MPGDVLLGLFEKITVCPGLSPAEVYMGECMALDCVHIWFSFTCESSFKTRETSWETHLHFTGVFVGVPWISLIHKEARCLVAYVEGKLLPDKVCYHYCVWTTQKKKVKWVRVLRFSSSHSAVPAPAHFTSSREMCCNYGEYVSAQFPRPPKFMLAQFRVMMLISTINKAEADGEIISFEAIWK